MKSFQLKKKGDFIYRGNEIKLTADFIVETMEIGRHWSEFFLLFPFIFIFFN